MEAAYGGNAPWLLIEGAICDRFGWTLKELRQQPAGDTLQMWLALAKYEKLRPKTE